MTATGAAADDDRVIACDLNWFLSGEAVFRWESVIPAEKAWRKRIYGPESGFTGTKAIVGASKLFLCR